MPRKPKILRCHLHRRGRLKVGAIVIYRRKGERLLTRVMDVDRSGKQIRWACNSDRGSLLVCCNRIKRGPLNDKAKGADGTWRLPKEGEVKLARGKWTMA